MWESTFLSRMGLSFVKSGVTHRMSYSTFYKLIHSFHTTDWSKLSHWVQLVSKSHRKKKKAQFRNEPYGADPFPHSSKQSTPERGNHVHSSISPQPIKPRGVLCNSFELEPASQFPYSIGATCLHRLPRHHPLTHSIPLPTLHCHSKRDRSLVGCELIYIFFSHALLLVNAEDYKCLFSFSSTYHHHHHHHRSGKAIKIDNSVWLCTVLFRSRIRTRFIHSRFPIPRSLLSSGAQFLFSRPEVRCRWSIFFYLKKTQEV